MKQRESKDVTQKNLEGYPDVAADILNVFIHGGMQEVQPELLYPVPTETEYASPGSALRNQLEDIRLHVFEMRHLPPEIIKLFRSDMRHVVDYLRKETASVQTALWYIKKHWYACCGPWAETLMWKIPPGFWGKKCQRGEYNHV